MERYVDDLKRFVFANVKETWDKAFKVEAKMLRTVQEKQANPNRPHPSDFSLEQLLFSP